MEIEKGTVVSSGMSVDDLDVGDTFRYDCDAGEGPVYMRIQDEDGNDRILDLTDGAAYELSNLADGGSSPVTPVSAKVVVSA
jgi:hypothetical protein